MNLEKLKNAEEYFLEPSFRTKKYIFTTEV